MEVLAKVPKKINTLNFIFFKNLQIRTKHKIQDLLRQILTSNNTNLLTMYVHSTYLLIFQVHWLTD
jgi:hypothetical protein